MPVDLRRHVNHCAHPCPTVRVHERRFTDSTRTQEDRSSALERLIRPQPEWPMAKVNKSTQSGERRPWCRDTPPPTDRCKVDGVCYQADGTPADICAAVSGRCAEAQCRTDLGDELTSRRHSW